MDEDLFCALLSLRKIFIDICYDFYRYGLRSFSGFNDEQYGLLKNGFVIRQVYLNLDINRFIRFRNNRYVFNKSARAT